MHQSGWSSTEAGSTSKHAPPPSKPLPPIPRPIYFMLLESPVDTSLLSHPVPSPSLYVDEIMSYGTDKAYHNPGALAWPSSTQGRDSTTSLIEFIEALLPPTPTVTQHRMSVDDIECYLVDPKLPLTSPIASALKGVVTTDQPERLCREMEHHQVQRRDSAMFDTTQSEPLALKRNDPSLSCCTSSPPSTASSNCDDLVGSIRSSIASRSASSSTASSASTEDPKSERGQTSFIEWDDEISRLAKVKKSFADLKTAARTRSDSAPLVTVQTSLTPGDRQVSTRSNSRTGSNRSTTKRPRSFGRRVVTVVRPRSPFVGKRDSVQSRKSMICSSTKSAPLLGQSMTTSPPTRTEAASPSFREQQESGAGSYSRKRRRGLDNLSCWMRKVMRIS